MTITKRKDLPEDGAMQKAALKELTLHNIKEYTHLAKILPLIYNEESGKHE